MRRGSEEQKVDGLTEEEASKGGIEGVAGASFGHH